MYLARISNLYETFWTNADCDLRKNVVILRDQIDMLH